MGESVRTAREMIRTLNDNAEAKIAEELISIGEILGCKQSVRYATAHKRWE